MKTSAAIAAIQNRTRMRRPAAWPVFRLGIVSIAGLEKRWCCQAQVANWHPCLKTQTGRDFARWIPNCLEELRQPPRKWAKVRAGCNKINKTQENTVVT